MLLGGFRPWDQPHVISEELGLASLKAVRCRGERTPTLDLGFGKSTPVLKVSGVPLVGFWRRSRLLVWFLGAYGLVVLHFELTARDMVKSKQLCRLRGQQRSRIHWIFQGGFAVGAGARVRGGQFGAATRPYLCALGIPRS